MKSLIVYSSQTGNTRKLAEAVRNALPGETAMVPVDSAPSPEGYDLVAVGFWLQAGKPDPKAAAYLQYLSNTPLFLFATHGAASDSGEVNPKGLEKIRAKTPPPPWIGDAEAAVGHPDAQDLARLQEVIGALNLDAA